MELTPTDVVYISSYSFHHDADYYQQPEEFIPERFDELAGGVKKYANQGVFMPFGNGPRMCPGRSGKFKMILPLVSLKNYLEF